MAISLIIELHLVSRLFTFSARLFTVCGEFLNTTMTTTMTTAETENVDRWICDQ